MRLLRKESDLIDSTEIYDVLGLFAVQFIKRPDLVKVIIEDRNRSTILFTKWWTHELDGSLEHYITAAFIAWHITIKEDISDFK